MHESSSPAPVSRAQVVWLALALSLGAAVSLGITRFAYALLLPPMREDLGWSYTLAGGMNTINALGYLLGALATPVLLRRQAPGRLLLGGAVLATVFMGLCGFFLDAPSLLLQRLLAGVASALIFIAGGLMAARLGALDAPRSGLLLGLYYGGTGVGIVLSAVLVPWVLEQAATQLHAWRWAWWLLALASLHPLTPTDAHQLTERMIERRIAGLRIKQRQQPFQSKHLAADGSPFGHAIGKDVQPAAIKRELLLDILHAGEHAQRRAFSLDLPVAAVGGRRDVDQGDQRAAGVVEGRGRRHAERAADQLLRHHVDRLRQIRGRRRPGRSEATFQEYPMASLGMSFTTAPACDGSSTATCLKVATRLPMRSRFCWISTVSAAAESR
mgnify:CR=1 FL=1